MVPESDNEKLVFVEFDGIYRNCEVWINGHALGKRRTGISRSLWVTRSEVWRQKNIIAVRVDNSRPIPLVPVRIYRNIRLVTRISCAWTTGDIDYNSQSIRNVGDGINYHRIVPPIKTNP
jgi:hypothetical protein